MNELQIFNNAEFGEVRTMSINGEPWLVGKDVAEALGYADPNKAIAMHIDDEDKLNDKTALSLGQRGGWLINESGLYSLVMNSKLPKAKEFKRWVTSEVLPSIRKHGLYATTSTLEQMIADPNTTIRLLEALRDERSQREALEAKTEENKPKVVFAEAVSASKSSILIGELAKLIAQNGVEIGQKRLFAWMREHGYLGKNGSNRNVPTQRSIELGVLESKETVVQNPDGSSVVRRTPKVTGKGQVYFVNKFVKEVSADGDKASV